MYNRVISMAASTILLLGALGILEGCSSAGHRQQPGNTLPSAGTAAIIDGTATGSVTSVGVGATDDPGMINSEISDTTDEERRYEYRSGR